MIKSIIAFFTLLFLTVPQAQEVTYTLDKAHTFIEFNVDRFMVGEVSGVFREFEGNITYEEGDPLSMQVDVIIHTASLDTGHETRDSHLRGANWLDAEQYPEIRFTSGKVTQEAEKLKIWGELTIHGTTREVALPFILKGPLKDPTGMITVGLAGELVIDRQDYGINFSRVMDNGEIFIGNEVRINIHALAIQEPS